MDRKVLCVSSARDLGPQFVDNPHRMVGQDGAYSIPLQDGTALWFFGDTLIGERPNQSLRSIFRQPVNGQVVTDKGPFEQMITNTGLILRNRTGAHGLDDFSYILDDEGNLKKLVPSLASEDPDLQRVWCQHGMEIDDKIYLSYILILMHTEIATEKDIGFEILGSGLAEGHRRDWNFRRLAVNGDTLWWKVGLPQFGAAMYYDEPNGHVYLYGTLTDAETVQRAYVARVQRHEIAQLSCYEYLAGGDQWSRDVGRAVSVFSGQPNELSVSYNRHLHKYLAVHSLGLSGDIVGRTADQPWGPWSAPTALWSAGTMDEHSAAPLAFYAGKEHPELAAENGRICYLTYIESNEYFPHLIEVTLA